jgi:hypothetical protein
MKMTADRAASPLRLLLCLLSLSLAAMLAGPASAFAAPDLRVRTFAPDAVTPGLAAVMGLTVWNAGDQTATGPVTFTVSATSGLAVQSTPPSIEASVISDQGIGPVSCVLVDQTLTCDGTLDLPPGAQLQMGFSDSIVAPDATGDIEYELGVSGADLDEPFTESGTMVVGPPPPFSFRDATVAFGDSDGAAARQAASAPHEFVTAFKLRRFVSLFAGFVPLPVPVEHMKEVVVAVPPGLIANTLAVPRCTSEQLIATANNLSRCPSDSQVGLFHTVMLGSHITPLYNMVPPPGAPAALGFNLYGVAVQIVARVRDSDYGVEVVTSDISSTLPIANAEVTLWGVPADERHDPVRGSCMDHSDRRGAFVRDRLCPSGAAESTFTRLPTSCSGEPLAFSATIEGLETGSLIETGFEAPSLEGCDEVPFDPSFSATPTEDRAGAPTGLDAVLSMPQHASPRMLAQADLRRARVTLPEGMTINPSSAGGLAACGDASLRIGKPGPATCPNGSKIGTVSVKTPLLDHLLEGSVYVRPQGSGDPASGQMFRIAVEVRSEADGIHMKLPGSVAADPDTGRLTTTFDNTPQLPFSEFRLRFKGGPRAPLVNPRECGEHTVGVELTGWNGAVRTPPASFELDEGCAPAGFDPSFVAGSVNPVAGVFSPFVARIVRPDGNRELSRIDMTLPKGMLADLSEVEPCANDRIAQAVGRSGRVAQAQPVCPAGSQVGTVTVGAGAGSAPFYPALPGSQASGRVFLTEAYTETKLHLAGVSAPAFGLAIEVPAVAGPYDLGDVVVRAALYVHPETAQVTVLSDPLPRVVKGVRLHVQDVRVHVDRERFATNPTSCEATEVRGDIRDPGGAVAVRRSRFQVGDCARLAFRPKLRMRLTGRRQMRTGGHPGIRAVLTQGGGQAGIARTQVRLPSSLALDPARAESDDLCEWRESLKPEPNCPASSVIGHAKAVTPLLKEPLEGPVYFAKRKRVNRFGREVSTLPSLVIALRGEIAINVRANTTVRPGTLITTFPAIPDAPVSRFELRLSGARKGILLVTRTAKNRIDLCARRQVAAVDLDGHNGRQADQRVAMRTSCARKAAKRARSRKG